MCPALVGDDFKSFQLARQPGITGIHPSWTLYECESRIFVAQVWHCQFDDGMYRLLAVFSESEIEYLFLLVGLVNVDKMKFYSFPSEEKRRRKFTR